MHIPDLPILSRECLLEQISIIKLQNLLLRFDYLYQTYPFPDLGIDGILKPIILYAQNKLEDRNSPPEVASHADLLDGFAFCQVKATENSGNFHNGEARYKFETKNLRYWLESAYPVVIFLVDLRDLSNEVIYWKVVTTDLHIKLKKQGGPQKTQTIVFQEKLEQEAFERLRRGINEYSDISLLLPEMTEFHSFRQESDSEFNKSPLMTIFNPIALSDDFKQNRPFVKKRILIPKAEFTPFGDPNLDDLSAPRKPDLATITVTEIIGT